MQYIVFNLSVPWPFYFAYLCSYLLIQSTMQNSLPLNGAMKKNTTNNKIAHDKCHRDKIKNWDYWRSFYSVYHLWFYSWSWKCCVIMMAAGGLTWITLKALKYCCINHGDQRFFSIGNHSKCLGYSSVRFIWISMLWWVYDHYYYFSWGDRR